MIRLLVGAALLPSAAFTLLAAAQAIWRLNGAAPSAAPFLAGGGLAFLLWLAVRLSPGERGPASWLAAISRRLYVFGHEMTHALAAWSIGAKVFGFKVSDSGGHVDLSHSNAFIALAPYCLPIYAALAVLAYRVLLWVKPDAGNEEAFLVVMGLTLAFHLLQTFETLWDRRQPDLAAAGGATFSLAVIGLANGLVLLLLVKALFPAAVSVSAGLREAARHSAAFWAGLWSLSEPFRAASAVKTGR